MISLCQKHTVKQSLLNRDRGKNQFFCSSKFHDMHGVTRILLARRQKPMVFEDRYHQNTGETAILDTQLRNSLRFQTAGRVT